MGMATLDNIKSARTSQEGIGNLCPVLQHDRLLVRRGFRTWLALSSGIDLVQNRLRVPFGARMFRAFGVYDVC